MQHTVPAIASIKIIENQPDALPSSANPCTSSGCSGVKSVDQNDSKWIRRELAAE